MFDRMLWLNPSDTQGVRFLIDPIHARARREDRLEAWQRELRRLLTGEPGVQADKASSVTGVLLP